MSGHPSPLGVERARTPLFELLFIALPTIAQMASYTVAQFIDTYMLSHASDLQATAVGQAGLLSFTVISFGFGVMMLVNALVSQAAGRGDLADCGQYMWQGIWAGLTVGLCCIPVALFGPAVFRWMGHTPELARLETQFFQTTVCFAAVKLCGMAMEQFMLAIRRPNIVLIAAVSGVSCMIPFNYCFIYGNFGMPRLGVQGAAWGLNLATTVEGAIIASVIFGSGIARQYHCFDWRFRRDKFRMLLATGIPSGFQVVSEVAAWSMFMGWVIAGHFSPAVMAANAYTFRFMSVSFMPAHGLSVAVTALVGRYIGMGKPDVAARRAHLGFAVAAVYMMVCGLLFFFAGRWLMSVFSADPAVQSVGATLLTVAGVWQFFDAMYLVYIGALRGAGDTFVPAVVGGTLCWAIVVAGGFLVAHLRPEWGPVGPWTLGLTYGVIISLFLMTRFARGHWRSIRLERDDRSANLPSFEVAAT